MQDEIAGSVVSTLKGRLAADSSAAVVAPRSKDLDAYGFYLEGRYHWNKRTEDELKKSVGCFERRDRSRPGLRTGLCRHGGRVRHARHLRRHAAQGRHAPCETRLRTGARDRRGLAEGVRVPRVRACGLSTGPGRTPSTISDERSTLSPPIQRRTTGTRSTTSCRVGRFDEATEELRRALDLDPLALAIKTSVGMKCYFAGQYDDAVRELSKTIELDESFGMARFFLGATYTELSRYPEAFAELEAAIRLPDAVPKSWRRSAIFTASLATSTVRAASWTSSSGSQTSGTSRRRDSPRCTSASANAWRRSTDWRRLMPSARPIWPGSTFARCSRAFAPSRDSVRC